MTILSSVAGENMKRLPVILHYPLSTGEWRAEQKARQEAAEEEKDHEGSSGEGVRGIVGYRTASVAERKSAVVRSMEIAEMFC